VAGAYTSDMFLYTIGRVWGKDLLKFRIFRKWFPEEKVRKVTGYFQKKGRKTLFFGRMFPLGVRNVLFFITGTFRMPLPVFMVLDILSLLITVTLFFSLGYVLSENYQVILHTLDKYKILFSILLVLALLIFSIRLFSGRKKVTENN
jgi:membrane protein DedA with SNARE-associated domain